MGAVAASAYFHDRPVQLVFDFDKLSLNADLGLENKEYITGCLISGEVQNQPVRRLRLSIPFVCGTDYFQPNPFIEAAYQATATQASRNQKLNHPDYNFDREKWLEVIWNRRSIRRFYQQSISPDIYRQILQAVQQPIPTENIEEIEIYAVVHRVEGMTPGIYRNTKLMRKGNFSENTGYLCINQAIARDCAVTLFFVSEYDSYQTAMQIVGFLGQRVYLFSNYWGIECSGIGAFYDDETQSFLETNKAVLYAMAIGK
jgi:hypothetical protein